MLLYFVIPILQYLSEILIFYMLENVYVYAIYIPYIYILVYSTFLHFRLLFFYTPYIFGKFVFLHFIRSFHCFLHNPHLDDDQCRHHRHHHHYRSEMLRFHWLPYVITSYVA